MVSSGACPQTWQHSTGTLAPVPAARATFSGNNAISLFEPRSGQRSQVLVLPVPLDRRGQAVIEGDAGSIAERGQFRTIGAAAPCAAGRRGGWTQRDLASRDPGHAAGEVGDGDLVRGADMVDAEVLPALAHDHHAANQVVDVAEAARLLAAALDRKRQHAEIGR